MGIAAYNRGTACLSRQIDDDRRPREFAILDCLNSIPPGPVELFCETVIRLDPTGKCWWLMDRQDEGWASYGRWFPRLRDVFRAYALIAIGIGTDKHSLYYTVQPRENTHA